MDNLEYTNLLKESVLYLANRCDHAQSLDWQGFSKADASFGHYLARLPVELFDRHILSRGRDLMFKYRKQLGLDESSLPLDLEYKSNSFVHSRYSLVKNIIDAEDGLLTLYFTRKPDQFERARFALLTDKAKQLKCHYGYLWSLPVSYLRYVFDLFPEEQWVITPQASDMINSEVQSKSELPVFQENSSSLVDFVNGEFVYIDWHYTRSNFMSFVSDFGSFYPYMYKWEKGITHALFPLQYGRMLIELMKPNTITQRARNILLDNEQLFCNEVDLTNYHEKRIVQSGEFLGVYFPYNHRYVELMREFVRKHFDGGDMCWIVEPNSDREIGILRNLVEEHGFVLQPGIDLCGYIDIPCRCL